MIYYVSNTYFLKDKNTDIEKINLWNRVVSRDDEVYILGGFADCSARRSARDIFDILKELNGIKYLVRGADDVCSNTLYRQMGFKEVYDHPVIIDNFWILSPLPLYFASCIEPYVNIFGKIKPDCETKTSNLYCLEEHCGIPVPIDEIEDSFEVCLLNEMKEGDNNDN